MKRKAFNSPSSGSNADQPCDGEVQTCPLAKKAMGDLPPVSPTIAIASPKIFLVKKRYQTKAHRLAVALSTDRPFTGEGSLTADPGGDIKLFDAKGSPQAMPLTIPGARLSKGVTLYVEAVKPSADLDKTKLSLSLSGGDRPIANSPVTDTLTCVELQLVLCRYKAAPGGADAPSVGDKINTGRNLHLQTGNHNAGRALLIVRKARPHGFKGDLVLKSRNSKVRTFAYPLEVPAPGQPVQSNPLTVSNTSIPEPDGHKLWVEGVAPSAAVLDTGFTLALADLPGQEGDRANITVVKAVLDVYNLDPTPSVIPDSSKMNPGRALHLQNPDNKQKRAKIVVRRVEPVAFTGKLELTVWDATSSSAANPRLKFFEAETPGGTAHPNPHLIDHNAVYPAAGKEVWGEGAILSDNLRDTEVRLRVSDAEGHADRTAFTVHQLFVTELKFKGIRKIYYARIPNSGSYILPEAADITSPPLPPKHFTPVEVRPAAGKPHWKKKSAKDPDAEHSWPIVYVRDGGANAPLTRELEASFDLYPLRPGTLTVKIKAETAKIPLISTTGAAAAGKAITATEQAITFTDGKATNKTFFLEDFPNEVKLLDGIEIDWCFHGAPAHKTKHTLYLVDAKPVRANNGLIGLGSAYDQYLWEIFEWACGWADGKKTRVNVLPALWSQFKPVKSAHATKLVYWKNYTLGISPAQDLVTAIQSQDDLNPLQKNAASCIVFDRVLMNCLAAHGIVSAEIKLMPPSAIFHVGGIAHRCIGWKATSTNGQGNPSAPPGWASHWIADVDASTWKLYDASYGAGPVSSSAPGGAGGIVDIQNYEPLAVARFDCEKATSAGVSSVTLPLNADPAIPPHLQGIILWSN